MDSYLEFVISIHALLAESDRCGCCSRWPRGVFLSTLSLRRATQYTHLWPVLLDYFYPRSPCGERRRSAGTARRFRYFYPRSPCGERLTSSYKVLLAMPFLSTLSLRRATAILAYSILLMLFLSTLSLRRATRESDTEERSQGISIHALLAESDSSKTHDRHKTAISIHALLAESDQRRYKLGWFQYHFYPRSPCGERLSACWRGCLLRCNFYPRSPCGERLFGEGE